MTDYNAMSLDELYGELETRRFDSIYEADEMEREAQRRSAVVTALCHLAADLDAEGLMVVPREPTLEMCDAMSNYCDMWAAAHIWALALTAAPLTPEVG